jgi:hypothetical protein
MVPSDGGQREVIDFLSKLESYGLANGAVERFETHGAIVFLVGDYAYKLKRAVRYPYMDYSTLERRKEMCERELIVNRRTAPDLYLEIRPIVLGADGRLRFGAADDAAIADWVVVMRRFDQDNLLEKIRQRGELTPALIRSLAETIAAFHSAAEITRDFGGAAGMAAVVAENLAILRSFVGRPFDSDAVERYARLSGEWLDRVRESLDARKKDGRIRRCHGDLHLNNICLIDGRPVLFDAIEFCEAFSCIDVFYDLSFLVMDLDRHRLRDHANTLLNRYLEKTLDHGGLAPLPLFLSCRAAIRAHVAATAAGVARDETPSRTRLEEAGTLFGQAIAYLEPAVPRLVALGGVSGTGKSTLARILAPMMGPPPGAVVIRSDVLRKQLMGVDETTRLPPAAYQPDVSGKVYARMTELAARILSAGHAVIVDAVHGLPQERDQIEGVAARYGVRFDGLWLEAPPAVLEERIAARRGDASDATVDVLQRQLGFIQRPTNWVSIDVSHATAEIVNQLHRRLELQEPRSIVS